MRTRAAHPQRTRPPLRSWHAFDHMNAEEIEYWRAAADTEEAELERNFAWAAGIQPGSWRVE